MDTDDADAAGVRPHAPRMTVRSAVGRAAEEPDQDVGMIGRRAETRRGERSLGPGRRQFREALSVCLRGLCPRPHLPNGLSARPGVPDRPVCP
jgi:hypothetical protein